MVLRSMCLQANRALHEAYWQLRSLAEEAAQQGQPPALPSHEELQLQALIMPGTGRRQLPSEAEKALQREKEALQQQLARVEVSVACPGAFCTDARRSVVPGLASLMCSWHIHENVLLLMAGPIRT